MPADGFYDFSKGFGSQAVAPPMTLISDITSSLRITTVNIYNCFSNEYDNYKIIGNLRQWGSVGGTLAVRFIRKNGQTFTSTLYDYQVIYASSTGGNFSISNGITQSLTRLGYPNGNGIVSFQTDVINPAVERRTQLRTDFLGKGTTPTEWSREWTYSVVRSTEKFTGIQFLSSSGTTLTGRFSIYGYRNT